MKKSLILIACIGMLVFANTNGKVYAATEEGIAGISTVLDRVDPIEIKSAYNITYNWCTARVNLRKDASMNSDIIVTLDKRTKVEVMKIFSKGWTQVTYGDVIGYIYSDYLTDIEFKPLNFSDTEIEIIQRITEAEATDQSIESKMNVASVIVNRILDINFPDTVKMVVFQDNQFSPIDDGRYSEVKITKETIEAVEKVLEYGVINDALYFCSMKDVKKLSSKEWFKKLKYLFKDDSGHSFYK
jgi:hypothetical protein